MDSFKKYLIDLAKCGYSQRLFRYQLSCVIVAAVMLVGCAPALYSVDMKYVPTRISPKAQEASKPIALTVATFQDMRKIPDKIVIGRVIKPNGEEIRVLPKFVWPSQAVTEPIKEFFRQAGYRVAAESPAWDLQESGINKAWEPILIGGSIDALEVVCQKSLTVTKYSAKTKLTIYFADTFRGKIFHTLTADSSASLDHVLFSEGMLEQQLNTALSGAIEKFFEGSDIINIINQGATHNN